MMRVNTRAISTAIILAVMVVAVACSSNDRKSASAGDAAVSRAPEEAKTMAIEITSTAFQNEKPIPTKYTCDADNVSPLLKWSKVPDGTKSIALICDDPDAPMGTFVHWVLYDMPPTVTELPEGLPTTEKLDNGAKQGVNGARRLGYTGPCPPPGKPHRYFFKLYALDKMLDLQPGAKKSELLSAMKDHVLGEGQVMGTYER